MASLLTKIRARAASGGFSLLEVIVSLAVLGIAITAVIALFSKTLGTEKKSSDYTSAVIYARSLMDEALSTKNVEDISGAYEFADGFSADVMASVVNKTDKSSTYEIAVRVYLNKKALTVLKGRRTVEIIEEKS